MINQHDALLLQGKFLDDELPPELRFLSRYFTSETEKQFVFYYLSFNGIIRERGVRPFYLGFVDHTGFYCSEQWMHILVKKARKILDAFEKAKNDMDLGKINFIKDGKYKGKKAI